MSETPTPPALDKARLPLFIAFSAIWTGLVVTEFTSNVVLPLTIREFTEEAWIIALILAINPAFGFVAQPVVGIVGDRIWTPLGRRAFFLITGAPVVALCLVFVPEAGSLLVLILLVIIYQFVQDILWGSDHPLLADIVPAEQRTRMMGLMNTCAQIAGFLYLRYALNSGSDLFGENFPYHVAAGAQVLLVVGGALYIKRFERPVVRQQRPPLTVKRYITDALGDPVLRRYSAMVFCSSCCLNMVQGFAALFAVHTLLITRGEFGEAWSFYSVLPIFLAFATSWAVERYLPKQVALVIGFLFMIGGSFLGLFSTGVDTLTITAIIISFGNVVYQVTYKPFFTEFLPRDIIGQLSGALNISYALGRTFALVGGGAVISMMGNNYRYAWVLAIIAGIASIFLAAGIPDRRFAEKQRLAKQQSREN